MTSTSTLPLFRSLLRNAKQLNDYNFRVYAIRRVKTGFRANQNLQGNEADSAFRKGTEQLEVLKRQVTMGNMYPSARSVME
eukprot:CAMPEP_0195529974 /NCGR_PEP_ID=MMETSP0794_2-20130614/32661_1 /TAXON_ID=515487 /ORGANISM="Stephanopyxis turris, Strain CCMP 815" /LENGTH=80 /DNA_ID=CAMNT_0040661365 /DNA_START=95 /DNA_END=337 /DNA_ORIENTATION=+